MGRSLRRGLIPGGHPRQGRLPLVPATGSARAQPGACEDRRGAGVLSGWGWGWVGWVRGLGAACPCSSRLLALRHVLSLGKCDAVCSCCGSAWGPPGTLLSPGAGGSESRLARGHGVGTHTHPSLACPLWEPEPGLRETGGGEGAVAPQFPPLGPGSRQRPEEPLAHLEGAFGAEGGELGGGQPGGGGAKSGWPASLPPTEGWEGGPTAPVCVRSRPGGPQAGDPLGPNLCYLSPCSPSPCCPPTPPPAQPSLICLRAWLQYAGFRFLLLLGPPSPKPRVHAAPCRSQSLRGAERRQDVPRQVPRRESRLRPAREGGAGGRALGCGKEKGFSLVVRTRGGGAGGALGAGELEPLLTVGHGQCPRGLVTKFHACNQGGYTQRGCHNVLTCE